MKQATLAAVLAVLALSAPAAPINCSGVSNVQTVNGAGCSVAGSPMVFSNFSVDASAGFTNATIGITAGRFDGSETFLDFQIGGIRGAGSPSMGDIVMQYKVTGHIDGVDISMQATPAMLGGNITITEIVCSVRFLNNMCPGRTLANIMAISTGNAATAAEFWRSGDDEVWIKKDIQFNGATMSGFTNSHASVPEPVSAALMGVGLLALGVLKRHPRKG